MSQSKPNGSQPHPLASQQNKHFNANTDFCFRNSGLSLTDLNLICILFVICAASPASIHWKDFTWEMKEQRSFFLLLRKGIKMYRKKQRLKMRFCDFYFYRNLLFSHSFYALLSMKRESFVNYDRQIKFMIAFFLPACAGIAIKNA